MELYAYGEAKAGRGRPRTKLLARPRRAPGPRPVSPGRRTPDHAAPPTTLTRHDLPAQRM